jgi:hypothetical protein
VTRHLSRDERLLALDGALDPARREHLDACAACRTEIEALGGVLQRVRAVDVPEPSPLFWDHLARRVGDAIAQEPVPVPRRPWWAPRLAWAAIALVAVAVTAGYVARQRRVPVAPPVTAHVVVPPEPQAPDAALLPNIDLTPDENWALIAATAEDAGAEALEPQVGQAEWTISSLSAAERAALAQELAAELAARGGSGAAFDGRCIPPLCVARPSNIANIVSPRALIGGRLAGLGATRHFHHGPLAPRANGREG